MSVGRRGGAVGRGGREEGLGVGGGGVGDSLPDGAEEDEGEEEAEDGHDAADQGDDAEDLAVTTRLTRTHTHSITAHIVPVNTIRWTSF